MRKRDDLPHQAHRFRERALPLRLAGRVWWTRWAFTADRQILRPGQVSVQHYWWVQRPAPMAFTMAMATRPSPSPTLPVSRLAHWPFCVYHQSLPLCCLQAPRNTCTWSLLHHQRVRCSIPDSISMLATGQATWRRRALSTASATGCSAPTR